MPSGIDAFYFQIIMLTIADLVGQFHNFYFDLILIVILIIGWFFTKKWTKKISTKIVSFSTKIVSFLKKPIPYYFLVLFLIANCALIFFIYNPSQITFPEKLNQKITPFEIIEPKDGDYVEYKSKISGHGAIPGSLIKVYIRDKYSTHLQETTPSDEDGNWTCNDVQIGQFGSQSAKQGFTIFANYTKDNKSYNTPHINVIRS